VTEVTIGGLSGWTVDFWLEHRNVVAQTMSGMSKHATKLSAAKHS
jgi:hypothetical protein